MGADLVGKVEAGIPEDHPLNPATIADNVGDNVGDVAGMGADIFESFVGSIIAAMVIAAASAQLGSDYLMIPIVLAAVGYIASIIGVFSMSAMKNMDAAAALRNTTFIAAILFLVGGYYMLDYLGLPTTPIWAVAIGSVVGILIGLVTEYYTGIDDKDSVPVKIIPSIKQSNKVVILYPGASPYSENHPKMDMLGRLLAKTGFNELISEMVKEDLNTVEIEQKTRRFGIED